MFKIKIEEQWVETLTLLFLVLGFMIAVLLQNPSASYLLIFLAGALAGRVYYIKRFKEPILPTILIMLGFLFGYLAASIWASRVITLFFFVLGAGVSYYLHVKEILVIFKSKGFIK